MTQGCCAAPRKAYPHQSSKSAKGRFRKGAAFCFTRVGLHLLGQASSGAGVKEAAETGETHKALAFDLARLAV